MASPSSPAPTRLHFAVAGMCCNDEVKVLTSLLRREKDVGDVTVLLLANKAIVSTPLSEPGAVDELAERLITRAHSGALRMTRQGSGGHASLTVEVSSRTGEEAAALFAPLQPQAVAGVEVSQPFGRRDASGRRRRAVTLQYDPTAIGAREIVAALPAAAGASVGVRGSSSATAGAAGDRSHAQRLAGAVALTVTSLVLDYAIPHDTGAYDEPLGSSHALSARILVQLVLATIAALVYGLPLASNAVAAFAASRTLTMDTLVTISSGVAYVYGICLLIASAALKHNVASEDGMGEPPFEATAVLLGLVAVGREIEQGAKRRTQHAVQRLTQLTQVEAMLAIPAAVAAGDLLQKIAGGAATAVKAVSSGSAGAATPPASATDYGAASAAASRPAEATAVTVAGAAAAAAAPALGVAGSALPPDLLHLGDVITVAPGQRFPCDGTVAGGSSSANESIVTGESAPVAKTVGASVIGGSTNGEGVLQVRVTALPSTGTISRIVAQIQAAQAARPRVQQVADTVSSWFTPFILASGVLVFIAWIAAGYSGAVTETQGLSPAAFAAQFALSLIVVSCPCAIGLAVPTVIMVATSVAARHGLLLKSGAALESAALIKHVIFDKTGTLTEGKPTVAQVLPVAGRGKLTGITGFLSINFAPPTCSSKQAPAPLTPGNQVLAVAACVATGSTHPLSAAIAAHAKSLAVPTGATGLERSNVNGQGITCRVPDEDDVAVLIGSPAFVVSAGGVKQADIDKALATAAPATAASSSGAASSSSGAAAPTSPAAPAGGYSVVCVACDDGSLLGVILLTDAVRDEAAHVVAALRNSGIEVWCATGDNAGAAALAAKAAGIDADHTRSALSPADKASLVTTLQAGGTAGVAMVGDGINDAVALTAADVGVAMGAGTAIAMDCADVVVRGESLAALTTLLQLSRVARTRIWHNFAWAAVYNVIAMPLAAGVLFPAIGRVAIPPAFAGISELLSSVPVVLGSLLVYRFAPTALPTVGASTAAVSAAP